MTPTSTTPHLDDEFRVELLADVQVAAELFAPAWPLTSFVAVNPLGGVQHHTFDEATTFARAWLGARTHLDLEVFRSLHRRGTIGERALRRAVRSVAPTLDGLPRVDLGRCRLSAVDVAIIDLLHGPPDAMPEPVATAGRRGDPSLSESAAEAIDELVASWCAAYVDDGVGGWRPSERRHGLFGTWHGLAAHDRRLRQLVGRDGHVWVTSLPVDAAEALQVALDELGVAPQDRSGELRAQLARLPGWAGHARWCDVWASPDHPAARLRLVDLVALRTVVEAASVRRIGPRRPVPPPRLPAELETRQAPDPERVDAVLELLGVPPSADTRRAVATVLEVVTEPARRAIWLAAHEAVVRDELLGRLDVPRAEPPAATPTAQVVTCIDVRSEGLRRHLEAVGPYETFGAAGFFGIPVAWRPLGSAHAEARCPVLLVPDREIREQPAPGAERSAARRLGRARRRRGVHAALHAAKADVGAPFVYAESAGWALGLAAMARTLWPRREPMPIDQRAGALGTAVDIHGLGGGGLSPVERRDLAGGLLRTIGLTSRFAPLVVLCGHGSATVNNPHASSLDCGACGGAPGGASARVAAALLNDPEVRAGLADEGIEIPVTTWFVAAEHDTAADQVAILDRGGLPVRLTAQIAELEQDLELAGRRLAAERARRLPGHPRRVRARGRDWAEIRPEWGLVRNAAFIVGPRSMTAGRDLDGRAFLHSYDATQDPDGAVLTGILTAPLVVAQWISAQYYFSTVDPVVFGAGDKLLHNPVGGIGVTLGDGGDLQVGLPWQSVALGDERVHEPVRLLAVIQAPRRRVAAIIQEHEVLRELVGGRWISVIVREHPSDVWTALETDGRWTPWRSVSSPAARAA